MEATAGFGWSNRFRNHLDKVFKCSRGWWYEGEDSMAGIFHAAEIQTFSLVAQDPRGL